jgi:hypothetical protein
METKPSEINRWGTARPIGRISIANIDAARRGFDLRQKGHHARYFGGALRRISSRGYVVAQREEIKLNVRGAFSLTYLMRCNKR